MERLRKKIIHDSKLNPFNDNFDIDYLKSFVSELEDNEESHKLFPFLFLAEDFNDLFQNTFSQLKKIILESNLNYDELIEFLITSSNRHYLLLQKTTDTTKSEFNFQDFFKRTIDSVDETIGKIDARAALETEIDSLNTLINYLNYFKNELNNSKEVENNTFKVDCIKKLSFGVTYFNVIRFTHEDALFNNGYIEYNPDSNTINYKYENIEEIFLVKIGYYRLNRNVYAHYLFLQEQLEKYDDIRPLISKIFEGKTEVKRIKKTKINNGLVEYELASGHDKKEFYNFLLLEIQLKTYYDFIYNVEMPKAEGLSLKDCLILFNMIQSIFNCVVLNNNVIDDSIMRTKDFGKFPSKINANNLKQYLKTKTKYSTKQINYFLSLLVNKIDKRLNFWDYPFLEKEGYYYVPLLSFLNPLIFVLSDNWLEDSGFDLEERGSYFEKNIKEKLSEALANKKYNFFIPNIPKYKLPNGKFEEIDLIMNLKSVVIIAEVKCIKYSLTPRDEFNALKRLREGAKQINRKAEFIANNSEKFKNEIGDITGKKIIKIVLTNFPSYSGYIIENVPIVDYYLIESYIKSGRISSYRYVSENGKITENKLMAEELFYNNEDEFCNNFESFVLKPSYIEKCRDYFEFKVNKLSVENDRYNIYSDSVEFKTE